MALNMILLGAKYDYLTLRVLIATEEGQRVATDRMLIVKRPSGHYKTQLNEILHCVKQYSRNLFNAEKETT